MAVKIDIKEDEDNLKNGLLGLVIALVEIIRDALRLQAEKRIESGSLCDEEIERLGMALERLDHAIEEMKEEKGISDAVQNIRDGLDDVVDKMVNGVLSGSEKE